MLYTVTTIQLFNNNIINTFICDTVEQAVEIRRQHVNNMIDLYADDTLDVNESLTLGYTKVSLNDEQLMLLIKIEQHNK